MRQSRRSLNLNVILLLLLSGGRTDRLCRSLERKHSATVSCCGTLVAISWGRTNIRRAARTTRSLFRLRKKSYFVIVAIA